jgi:hypothetical protein
MQDAAEWSEFRIWYGEKCTRETLYDLRKSIIDILDQQDVVDFLVLNEPEFVILRINVGQVAKRQIEHSLVDVIAQSRGAFERLEVESWKPEEDARGRILSAGQRAREKFGLNIVEGKGWKVSGLPGEWIADEDDIDMKVKEFSTFMTRVVGDFTRSYVRHMPRQIEDRWLLSLLVHLLLNSISVDQRQETEVRYFPYI